MAPYLDPINQAFIDAGAKAGGPPLHELPFIEARNVLEGLQEHKPASDVTTEDIEVTAGSSGTVKTVIYKPANAKGELPIALYTHGGGWILGRFVLETPTYLAIVLKTRSLARRLMTVSSVTSSASLVPLLCFLTILPRRTPNFQSSSNSPMPSLNTSGKTVGITD